MECHDTSVKMKIRAQASIIFGSFDICYFCDHGT